MKEKYLREQCQEYFTILENDKKVICYKDQRKFTNGKYVKNFWKRNSGFIFQEISLEKNKLKYPTAYQIIFNLYNKGSYYLTEEQRFKEFFEEIEKLGYMITKDYKNSFSDGYKYSSFIIKYFDYIVIYANENKNIYPKAYKIINDYLVSKDAFLVKCIEFFNMIENDNEMITSNDDRFFSNAEKVKYFWFRNYEKIYFIICQEAYKVQYPKTYDILTNVYQLKKEKQQNNSSIRDRSVIMSYEDKMHELFSFMEEKQRKINVNDKDLFQDKTRLFYFWANNRRDLIQNIQLEKNKEKYPIVYKLFFKKPIMPKTHQDIFNRKFAEFVDLVEKNGDMKFVYNIKNRFSDNTIIYRFWYNHSDKIYKFICDYEKAENRLGYRMIKAEYERKQLTYNDKIMEYIKLVDKTGSILSKRKDLTFSDGRKVDSFWINHRKDIVVKFCDDKIRNKYSKACLVLQRSYYHEAFLRIRLDEYLSLVEENNCLMNNNVQMNFSDQTTIYGFTHHHRDYIEKEILKEKYQDQYPKACDLILKNKVKSKVK